MNYIENTLEQSFLDYSAFVIQRRSIPDARDMFKYTARQILHAQAREKLDYKHPFKKSQKSVSAATSFSYVHGGASAYEQIIRMGRPLVQRYFLEEVNGNGGTPMNSSDYSAERYTEARLSELTCQLFKYIEMNTIPDDWEPTYDEEGVFPKVLPSVGYYNICNGTFGSIAPTMISSVPQFNLREVNEAICCLIDNPENDIVIYPDFASGGTLLNPKTTMDSLNRGEGKSALIRGKLRLKPKDGYLEIIELPYGVYTNTICTELEKALDKGDVPFTEFKDLSKRSVNLRIYSKHLDKLEEWLYKNTSVQKHFTIKMIMLDGGKTPRLFNIKTAMLAHIAHATEVFRRQYLYHLEQLKTREEVIRGLLKAYSILDEVIATIKGSAGRANAIQLLISQFEFTQIQAEAIVDLRLHRLSTIDIEALHRELEENLNQQADIQETLDIKDKFNMQLKSVYEEVAKKFGDNRRTEICQSDAWETCQDGDRPNQDFIFTFCEDGYSAMYSSEAAANGFVGDTLIELDDEVVLITDQVRGFVRKGIEFTMGNCKFSDLVKLNADERVIAAIKVSDLEKFEFVEMRDSNDKIWSMHKSFVLTGASKRGKKLVTGKYKITQIHLEDTTTSYPKIR